MGWWPFSSGDISSNTTGQPDSAPAPKRDFSLTDEQHQRIFGRPRQDHGSSSARDAQADSELSAFLREIGATSEPSGTTAATADAVVGEGSTQALAAPSQANTNADGRRIHPDGSLDITPEALYPRSMSCRQAFDQAFYCQSLGGKFNDIYRYGALQSCSEQWSAFWFCMRVRQYADKDKQEVIKEFYKDRDATRQQQFGSSEDVWEIRTKGVEKAFWRDPKAEDGDVALKE